MAGQATFSRCQQAGGVRDLHRDMPSSGDASGLWPLPAPRRYEAIALFTLNEWLALPNCRGSKQDG